MVVPAQAAEGLYAQLCHTPLASCNVHGLHRLDQCNKQVGILEGHFRIGRLVVPKAFGVSSVMVSEADC